MPEIISKRDFWFMNVAGYLCMICEGMIDNLSSVTLPDIKQRFEVNDQASGWFNASVSAGYLVFTFLGAVLVKYIGFRWVMALGFIGGILGSIGMATANSFLLATIFQFISCMGVGLCDMAPESLGALLYTKNTVRHMTLLCSFYAVGAYISPAFAGLVIEKTNWAYPGAYYVLAGILVIMALYILMIPFQIKKPIELEKHHNEEQAKKDIENHVDVNSKKSKEAINFWNSLLTPMVWFFSLTFALLTIVDRAGMNWAGLYIDEYLGLSSSVEGAVFNSVYFFIYWIARLLGGFFTDYLGPMTTLYTTLTITIVLFLIGFLIGTPGIWVICATGFFVAFFWPTLLCLVIEYFGPVDSTIHIGIILPLQSLIQLLFQPALGALNDAIGNAWAFRSTIVFGLVGLVFVGILHFILKRHQCKINELAKKIMEENKKKNCEIPEVTANTITNDTTKNQTDVSIEQQAPTAVVVNAQN
ncbi:hypothetical protein WA158_002359 [Blastocystis sp. Blastoise]